jgi:hypothetical protein
VIILNELIITNMLKNGGDNQIHQQFAENKKGSIEP